MKILEMEKTRIWKFF